MSTRCTIRFCFPDMRPCAIVYRHSDGYPDGQHGVPADLNRFFDDVKAQTNDWRFGDPSYLAAKYVVWQAHEYAHRWDWETGDKVENRMLDFLSVGIVLTDPTDIEYRYYVICNGQNPPEVKWEETVYLDDVQNPFSGRPDITI